MIEKLNEIAFLARVASEQAESCLETIDKWQEEQEESYKRVSAALDATLEALNQITA